MTINSIVKIQPVLDHYGSLLLYSQDTEEISI
jgi:hypothetical protein